MVLRSAGSSWRMASSAGWSIRLALKDGHKLWYEKCMHAHEDSWPGSSCLLERGCFPGLTVARMTTPLPLYAIDECENAGRGRSLPVTALTTSPVAVCGVPPRRLGYP